MQPAPQVNQANRKTVWKFLEYLLEILSCKVHTILTDNGNSFEQLHRNPITAHSLSIRFDLFCDAIGIESRLTKPDHLRING